MFTLEFIIGHFNNWIVIILMMAGLYVVLARSNLVKKLIGLNVFQTSVFLLYISMGKLLHGTAPIEVGGHPQGHIGGLGGEHGAEHAAGHAASTDHGAVADAVGHGLAGASQSSAGITGVTTPGLIPMDTPTVNVDKFDIPQVPGMPLETAHNVVFSNPLPHVLILTAIVVGVATLAVGLAIIVRIRECYGTIEEDELLAADRAAEFGEAAPR